MLNKGLSNTDVKAKFNKVALDYNFYPYTLAYKADIIRSILEAYNKTSKNVNILDIGVAGAELASLYLGKQNLTGIDISIEMIRKAKMLLPQCNFFEQDGEDLEFQDESFDVVVSSDVFYYMEDPGRSISESFRILKQGGLIIILSRNQFYQKFDLIRKLLNIGPTDDMFSRLFYKRELHKMLIENSFNNVCSLSFCVIPVKGFSFMDNTIFNYFGHYSYAIGNK